MILPKEDEKELINNEEDYDGDGAYIKYCKPTMV